MNLQQITRALQRKLCGKKHDGIMNAYFREKLPKIRYPANPAEWRRRTAAIRRDLLAKVYLRGHQRGILKAPPKVQWRGVIETGKGYRIRKLRYEGYPGMWIPALLYEPAGLKGKVPAVLNVNGHHAGGKAMPYKQVRCINLAKRGMLALNTEFVGMGELQGCGLHMQQGHIDLCGVAGVGVMVLAMKRGLDVLLAHRHADPERVAMTGLSGGGWQTAVLSALDERIRAVIPVSGHSPIWHRATVRPQDHGDLEQTPVDLCTVADYDTLTAMFAPRPALLVHSVNDSIFRPEFMRPALFKPARRVYGCLGVKDRIQFYANEDPGTHNYEKDIREQLYVFLKDAWGLDMPTADIPCDGEIFSEWDLAVGLPPDNPTFVTIAADLANGLPKRRSSLHTRAQDRERLAKVLRLPPAYAVRARMAGKPRRSGGVRVAHVVLGMDRWRVPVTEFRPARAGIPTLVISGAGRAKAGAAVKAALRQRRRVFAADLFAFGEQVIAGGERHYLFMECVAAAGDRPLGLCVAQLLALLGWVRSRAGAARVDIVAEGLSAGLAALCAAALRPKGIGRIQADVPDTLRRLIDRQVSYVAEPVAFCFGLFEQFDIRDLVALSDPVELEIAGRGPLRPMRLTPPRRPT
ncbi:MAG: acetylxylan esterase [Kiritimatiellae bacterium]|nr:acetylxylan esterase [Kiritimatiellia bacterium]